MFVLSAAEMRECDRRTIEEGGVPGPVLMERAGWGVFHELRRRFEGLNRRRIVIVCGKGNNGGDGLVLARLLHDAGHNPQLLLTDSPIDVGGDASFQIAPLVARGVALGRIGSDHLSLFARLSEDDIIVDAVFGTGFKGTISGPRGDLIDSMNRSPAGIVSIDIPSGLSADHGRVGGPAIRALLTITMAFPKRSFLFWPARGHVGEWVVVDIGIPPEIVSAVRPVARIVTPEDVRRMVPVFAPDAHKGTRGKVLIAGGSPGLTGAPCLAATGALRAGAGLVRVAIPRSLNSILETKLTEAMTFPMPETEAGTLASRAREAILSLRESWDALVLGPGLGRNPETDRVARDLFIGWGGPLVVDADGLNALAPGGIPMIEPLRSPPVLTPHVGEMARLLSTSISEILADPVDAARRFSQRHGVVLLLKGSPTLISDPTGNLLVSTSGNPALATGGAGDVLSGMIGAFLAQGIDPWWAAGIAAYLHGRSADRLVRTRDERGVTPTQVAEGLADPREPAREPDDEPAF